MTFGVSIRGSCRTDHLVLQKMGCTWLSDVVTLRQARKIQSQTSLRFHRSISQTRGTAIPEYTMKYTDFAQGLNISKNTGEIHLITGPMFSGKTTELLERVSQEEALGLVVSLVKSFEDFRYSCDHIVTHDGILRTCFSVAKLNEIRSTLGDAEWRRVDIFAIDEAQFLPDLPRFCAAADSEKKKIIFAGLEGDFRREQFGKLLDLLPLCDSIFKLSAKCCSCNIRPATFTSRISPENNTAQQCIGGSDTYQTVCRSCFVRSKLFALYLVK
jgi:thymidine kinase